MRRPASVLCLPPCAGLGWAWCYARHGERPDRLRVRLPVWQYPPGRPGDGPGPRRANRRTRGVTVSDVAAHQLAGFGSGIYSFTFHPQLWRLAAALRPAPGAAAFVFSTSGGPAALFWPSTRLLMALLARRGYRVIGSFSCRGA